jgi:hypothetical protein
MPIACWAIPEEDRAKRVKLTSDTCVIDDDTFFVRAVLELPIIGAKEPFTWGVWVSQSRESYTRYTATFQQDQTGEGSFGWLTVTMPGYAEQSVPLESLACDVRWGSGNLRPRIEPHPRDHPLYRDFADGITWERAVALAQLAMHGEEALGGPIARN